MLKHITTIVFIAALLIFDLSCEKLETNDSDEVEIETVEILSYFYPNHSFNPEECEKLNEFALQLVHEALKTQEMLDMVPVHYSYLGPPGMLFIAKVVINMFTGTDGTQISFITRSAVAFTLKGKLEMIMVSCY
jgi:hypothetical protein